MSKFDFSPWGKTVDEIVTCQAWKEQKRISAAEGLIAIAYERKQQQYSRIYQVQRRSQYQTCPIFEWSKPVWS